jgi:hypothetical protein
MKASRRGLFGRPLRFEPLEDRRLLSFTITAPASGAFTAGQNVLIQWTADGVTPGSSISLCYDKDKVFNNNETWIEINGVTAANGSTNYNWNTTGVPTGTYYIGGYMWDGGNTFTFSHLTTAITITSTAATFAITYPATGTFSAGQTIPIQWTAGNVTTGSKISLSYDPNAVFNDGNETWIEIDQVKAANGNGQFLWDTTGVAPGLYYVGGYLWDGANGFSHSQLLSPITISPQTFIINAPTSGTIPAGTSVNIQWAAANVQAGSKISLAFDPDNTLNGNEHWIEIDQVPAADGSGQFTWDTTGVPAGTYYMAGYMWNGHTTYVQSHTMTPITITAAPAQTFVVTAPASGTYEVGDPVDIQWTAGNVKDGSTISLAYDPNAIHPGNNPFSPFSGGETWIEINGVTATNGSDSYTWNTTGVTPGTYYIGGYLWNGANTFTMSRLTTSITINPAALTLETSAVKPATASVLTTGELTPIVAEAETRLTAALGIDVSKSLANVSFQITDLPGALLGEVSGSTVSIDSNAAGYGWFVDPTPGDDVEFPEVLAKGVLEASPQSPAAQRADLLTTVMHELGHELGFAHDDLGDLMSATLPLGVRRTSITPTLDPSLS